MTGVRFTRDGDDVWDDPTADDLWLVMDEIRDGSGQFVIVTRVPDEPLHFAQAAYNADGTWQVEKRGGDLSTYVGVDLTTLSAAHRVLAEWGWGVPNPDGEPAWEVIDTSSWG